MAYTINHYNGQLLVTVADGTVDATTNLKLVGKNYAGYGSIQNENFVYLLENFANSTAPSSPLTGQIWFDSGTSKLKFWDGSKFRTTGGAEIGDTAPSGLTTGDFWFDTVTNQLFAWGGSSFTLIGPQAVAGSLTTQMLSTSVKDTLGQSHAIIEGIANGTVIFTVSKDPQFTLDGTVNAITGFTTINQGITLAGLTNNSQPNVGQISTMKFWGTASNADYLGGLPATSYITQGSASFSSVVNFADVGYTVGNPTAKLKVFNNNSTTPTIQNQYGNQIVFQTTVSSSTVTPLQLVGADVLPGTTTTSNLGNQTYQWSSVWATTFNGNATSANNLVISGSNYAGSVSTSPSTIVARDGSGNVNANTFNGASTTSYYADLAEKYLPDTDYAPGTVMCIGGSAEVRAAGVGDFPIGVVSTAPGYMMNSDLEGGIYIALKGRVPVLCQGPVSKGDLIVQFGYGFGITDNNAIANGNQVFAVAIGSTDSNQVESVECLIL